MGFWREGGGRRGRVGGCEDGEDVSEKGLLGKGGGESGDLVDELRG